MTRPAAIALEDGTVLRGAAFGADGEKTGEVVFNTSLCGYQELLTDPSYKGQIVTMTYPLIGNYGVNLEDMESDGPRLEGFVVRELSRAFSNWRAVESLDDYLARHGVIGVQGVDTRQLTRHIRTAGALKGVISTGELDGDTLVDRARASKGLVGRDLVREVTCRGIHDVSFSDRDKPFLVSVIDAGIKTNILRKLDEAGCRLTVFPASASPDDILAPDPDGIFVSNGPGDPAALPYLVETVRCLIGTRPIFGICLGHQILGLALGGRTYKLKFGHRGGNHPVKDVRTGRIDITAQNHGFCVDADSLAKADVELTHFNLYDGTLEGMEHRELPVFSVQYHPEACPGPRDAAHLFERFTGMMRRCRETEPGKGSRGD